MAVEPIKTRCAACQQLLGVAPSKAGQEVACPKCGAAVLVPGATTSPMAPTSRPRPESPHPILPDDDEAEDEDEDDSDEGIPLDLLAIRPEDIRVAPGARSHEPSGLRESRPPASKPTPPPQRPVSPPPPLSPFPDPGVDPDDDEAEDDDEADSNLPAIQLDLRKPARSPSRTPPVRPTDLVVPRTVAATWSLLALLAVGFAFLTGLLVGHYVWRVH